MRVARLLLGVVLALALLAIPATTAGAKSRDRNHDRIPDRWERKHDLSLRVNQANRDQDRDGLVNKGEFRARTDPRDDDSDNDGVEDGDENAGRVIAFNRATGVLMIDVLGGRDVKGKVTGTTEIACESEDEHEDENDSDDDSREGHSSNNDEGDDEGHGEESDGDDGRFDGDDGEGPVHSGELDEGPEDELDDEGEWGDEDDECSTDDLVRAFFVHEATLTRTAAGAAFKRIKLVK
jgi:hypothetical protein